MPRFIAYFTDIFGFAHAYQIVVIAVSIVTVLTPIKKDRRSILIALARIAGVFAARVLIEALFFWGADFMPWLGRLCFPTATLFVVILYTVLFCRARLQLRFIEAAILSSALLAVDIYIVQFAFLTDLPMALTQVLKVMFSSINLVTVFVLVRYKLADFRYISGLYAAFTLINSAVVIVSIYVIELLRMYVFTPVIPETEVLTMTAIFGVAMYVMTIVSYLTMYNLCDKTERAISLRIEKTIIDENAKLLDVVQKNLDDIRQIRHDVKNNYVYLRMMLENGQTDEMNDYLNELCGGGGSRSVSPSIDCGNSVVMSILNMEKTKMEEKNIRLVTELNVPAVLPFKEVDLFSIIVNLVDNAIEAIEREHMTDATVRIKMSLRREYFYIRVVNPVPENTDKASILKLSTSKGNTNEHGYGTKIIRRLAESYNGFSVFSVENGEFIAEVMLNILNEGDGKKS